MKHATECRRAPLPVEMRLDIGEVDRGFATGVDLLLDDWRERRANDETVILELWSNGERVTEHAR